MQAQQRNDNKPNRIGIMYASMKSAQNTTRRRHAHHVLDSTVMLLALLLIALDYCANDAAAFNLENRLPIVKYGDADTYFGYSVAGHEIGEEDDGAATEKWWVISNWSWTALWVHSIGF